MTKVFLPFALFFVATELSSVATLFLPPILSFVAIFISISQQNSSAYSGAHLMQCRDRTIKCRDNTPTFRLSLCCEIYLCVATFFFILLLILCRDKVVKCHDILSVVILYFALSLLRYSYACCDKLLQIAFGFVVATKFYYVTIFFIFLP